MVNYFVRQFPVGQISRRSGAWIVVLKNVLQYLVRHGGHIRGREREQEGEKREPLHSDRPGETGGLPTLPHLISVTPTTTRHLLPSSHMRTSSQVTMHCGSPYSQHWSIRGVYSIIVIQDMVGVNVPHRNKTYQRNILLIQCYTYSVISIINPLFQECHLVYIL